MLKPEKMVKIRIIGLNKDKSLIVDDLHDLGIMQMENAGSEVATIFDDMLSNDNYKILSDYLSEFRGYLSILPKRPVKSKKYFNSIPELLDSISEINIKNELNELKESEDNLLSIIRENENYINILKKLNNFNNDLSILNNNYIESFVIENSELLNNFKKDYTTFINLNNNYFIVSINRKNESEFLSLLSSYSYQLLNIPEFSGTPEEKLKELESTIKDSNARLDQIHNVLNKISDNNYEKIAQIEEQLNIYVRELEVLSQTASSDNAFALEGWVPEREHDNIAKTLEHDSHNNVLIQKIKTDEEPPTKLSNPGRFKIFEFFIRFYSLPKEYEFDPTLIFALVFPVFFGLMVGDAGYGLVILLLSLFIIHRVNHPPLKSHIPKKISGFILMIMGKNSLKTLARALIPSSIIAIIFGVIFNEFFGFTIYPVPFMIASRPVPVTYLGKLLLISGYIGLAFVIFGFVIGIINNLYTNHKKVAVAKFGWIFMAIAFAVLGLNLIHRISLSPLNISSLIGYVLLVSGFILVVVFEGSQSLMEIPSIISHILSYTRIVGILLASVVLALVINTVFVGTLSDPFYFIIMGILILVFGQMFNIVIAVFEPGIQGARLLYVEFFSKFYFGNGKPFRPFGTDRSYTLKKFDKK